MKSLDYITVKNYLMEFYGYSADSADRIVERIRQMRPETFHEFSSWFKTGKMPDHYVNGIDLDALIVYRGYNPISAFLFADWYLRDPQQAFQMASMQLKDFPVNEEDRAAAREMSRKLSTKKAASDSTAE